MLESAIRKVVVVGGGTAGWMTAAVLSKIFAPKVSITVIESDEIGIVGVGEATIPQIRHINNFLGLDENDFLRNVQGTFKLGIQFNGWRRPGDSYIHAFGDIGMLIGLTPFHHYWLRARAAGARDSIWDYSLNAQAAAGDRFERLERVGTSRLAGIKYAFHFDAALYARYLRRAAESRGTVRVEGKIVAADRDEATGFVRSVRLENGQAHDADFFVDCSGFRGLLIEQTLHAGYEDWTRWLPCDRAVAVACRHGEKLRPYTQATARRAGWQWRIPLQHRVGNGHVYSSAHVGDDEAVRVLLDNLEGAPLAEPRLLRFTTGMRKRHWVKNCVAIGLASGFMEPLESTSIHLIQSSIARLVSMFPDRNFNAALIDEFNRQARFEFESIRDFLILHYHANERDDSDFWRACREMEVPPSVQAKIELFRASGRIYREHEELFTETGWLQVLLGQGIVPARYHPMADMLDESTCRRFLADIRILIGRAVSAMPSHRAFIDTHCRGSETD
ncbi:MAG: tryptophan 7-halogenase [Alphaproteobacteria bacterium]|nr:MAG: tryptophan 7-halogenase [Alphaproteobacteria bacterium]